MTISPNDLRVMVFFGKYEGRLVYIYTGTGKGKTPAAIGLTINAAGVDFYKRFINAFLLCVLFYNVDYHFCSFFHTFDRDIF